MRTISTAQEDLLSSVKYGVHLRVEVENSTGSMVALSSLGGAQWVEGARWDWNLDQPVAQLTVDVRRDHGPSTGESLAPLDEESTHNLELGSTDFGAAVDAGRDIDVYTAITAPGAAAPATSEYDWVFAGEIDDVLWERSPMAIIGRSKNFATLNDRWIESSTAAYGTSSGDQLDVVISQVLADWTDLSTSILLAPTTPGFVVAPTYQPDEKPVLGEVVALTQLIGWQVRDIWSTGSTSWRILLDEPDRTATSSDAMWTFGPEHYFDVRKMSVSRDDVRNYVSVEFGPSSSRQTVFAESTASQDKYGRRFMKFVEGTNSAIATSSEAATLAGSALSDLQDPPVTHEIEVPYFYPAELNDFYQFDPNGIHYSTQQYLATYGITHELSANRHRTSIRVRGKPAGQYTGWLTYAGGGGYEVERRPVAARFDAGHFGSLGVGFLAVESAVSKLCRLTPNSIFTGVTVYANASATSDSLVLTVEGKDSTGLPTDGWVTIATIVMSDTSSWATQSVDLDATAIIGSNVVKKNPFRVTLDAPGSTATTLQFGWIDFNVQAPLSPFKLLDV